MKSEPGKKEEYRFAPLPYPNTAYGIRTLKVGCQVTPEVVAEWEELRDELRLELRRKVAAWRPRREVRVPADWWQACRERWLPARWLRRHPVRYVTHEAIAYLLDLPVPDGVTQVRCGFTRPWREQAAAGIQAHAGVTADGLLALHGSHEAALEAGTVLLQEAWRERDRVPTAFRRQLQEALAELRERRENSR